jgi:hypothetical protein
MAIVIEHFYRVVVSYEESDRGGSGSLSLSHTRFKLYYGKMGARPSFPSHLLPPRL